VNFSIGPAIWQFCRSNGFRERSQSDCLETLTPEGSVIGRSEVTSFSPKQHSDCNFETNTSVARKPLFIGFQRRFRPSRREITPLRLCARCLKNPAALLRSSGGRRFSRHLPKPGTPKNGPTNPPPSSRCQAAAACVGTGAKRTFRIISASCCCRTCE
jgi:hypothetical protein